MFTAAGERWCRRDRGAALAHGELHPAPAHWPVEALRCVPLLLLPLRGRLVHQRPCRWLMGPPRGGSLPPGLQISSGRANISLLRRALSSRRSAPANPNLEEFFCGGAVLLHRRADAVAGSDRDERGSDECRVTDGGHITRYFDRFFIILITEPGKKAKKNMFNSKFSPAAPKSCMEPIYARRPCTYWPT